MAKFLKKIKDFIYKNIVLVIAVLSGAIIILQQALTDTGMSWMAIGFAITIMVLGKIANAWKGQGLTITGIIGTAAAAFVDTWNGGEFSIKQFIISLGIAILMAIVASLKPQSIK